MRPLPPIPKALAAIIVVYTISVLCGFVWLATALKVEGYVDGNPQRLTWTWSAEFLRNWGLLSFPLLLALWVPYALKAYRIDHGWLDAKLAIAIGIAMTLVIAIWLITTALDPVASRPFLYRSPD